ncbi:MAG: box helicase protein, partial [Acidobacteriota bacterium]|nr:box helicase protein [Acidobacteriota bacterium]
MGRNALAPDASLASLLDSLHEGKLGKQLVYSTAMPSTPARYGELDPPLSPALAGALARSGVERLWSHQAEGVAAVRRGENVLVTTPTASGKSLVFQLPALEEAAAGGPGRALFLFPLKALGQDQRGKFLRLAAEAGLPPEVAGCEIYDGDTPRALREAIRRNFPRVVVSNPDMLHLGVLGHWVGWGPFLADLRWIVLDELHTYRGIFGSHFHHVLARFLRLCRAVGANPQIIASSATAANAAEFAETLTGAPFHWISESGAPREGRHLLLFRPDGSPYTAALQLFVTLVKAGMKTIVFTKARRITELLYSWLRRQEPDLARRVASYRAGFLPEERRQIERDLFNGVLDGVISTSALEMGVDVGGLDACILVGYPGSMMATWQRSGRVGRDGRESITALVAMPDALDQYFLDHPQQFLERPCERLIVDPGNDQVARGHLVCAASELPLCGDDRAYLEPHQARVEKLLRQGHLLAAAEGDEIFSLRRRPQRHVNLRGTGETFAILAGGRTIGTV